MRCNCELSGPGSPKAALETERRVSRRSIASVFTVRSNSVVTSLPSHHLGAREGGQNALESTGDAGFSGILVADLSSWKTDERLALRLTAGA